MAVVLKIAASFETTLANKITSSATSMTLVKGTDDAGNTLSGTFGFVIDEGTASEEFVIGSASGTAVTSMLRGLDPQNPATEITALKKEHRRGATVKITDYPAWGRVQRLLNGDDTFPNKLSYASAPTFSSGNEIITKTYADALAIAGAPDASITAKGVVEEATQAEVDAGTAAGGTGARTFVNPSTVRAKLYHDYAADAGSTDAYAITMAPAPTGYSTGMVIVFKANTANTGACTINVNSLGVKNLKINGNYDPQDNYIKAGAFVLAVYDGTNFRILSAGDKPVVTQDGQELYGASSGGTDTYAITLAPAPIAYVTGQVFRFKADVANTGAATLNVNALGAKSILRPNVSALADGDIAANQLVEVIYDGTQFLMLSPVANAPKYTNGGFTRDMTVASGDTTIAHGLGRTPRFVRIQGWNVGGGAHSGCVGVYNGATTSGVAYAQEGATGETDSSSSEIIRIGADGGDISLHRQAATIAVDATNITVTWTKTGTPTGIAEFIWEAQV